MKTIALATFVDDPDQVFPGKSITSAPYWSSAGDGGKAALACNLVTRLKVERKGSKGNTWELLVVARELTPGLKARIEAAEKKRADKKKPAVVAPPVQPAQ